MEALPKHPQGVVIYVDEEQQGNQTGNYYVEDSHRPCSCSMSGTCYSSSCCFMEVDLESCLAETETSPHLDREMELDCRICHLTLDPDNHESGVPIELGCSCKDDLAAAHKHCAEAWFKIKGNGTCEICGLIARNVVAAATESDTNETWNESTDSTSAKTGPTTNHASETLNCWQGHRILNLLLACMVFAFVISWLFHFNVPS